MGRGSRLQAHDRRQVRLSAAATTAEIHQEPSHVWLIAQVQMKVGSQHIMGVKPFQILLTGAGTGEAVGTRG
jgi:hypothetical protein